MNKAPTIRQLAALAGVSRTTVSLALRNHPSIAESTRQRIQQLAAAHGYVQDPVVSALMNKLRIGRTKRPEEKLAFLTTWPKRDEWRTNSYNDRCYYEGAYQRAANLGYEIEVFWAKEPGMNARRLSKILYTRAIRGVIIPPLLRARGHLSLDWQHFACVTLTHTLFKPNLHRVAHSHFDGMMLVLRQLKQLGYKRIGYANVMDQDERGHHGWLAAYLAYQYIHHNESRISPFFEKKWNGRAFKNWLAQNQIEVVVSNWLLPIQAARNAGIEVPGGVAYVSLDVRETDWEAGGDPIAGVDQQPRIQGATAVDVVAAQIQRNEFGLPVHPKTTQIEGVWRDGKLGH